MAGATPVGINRRWLVSCMVEILLRLWLFALFCYLETLPPFVRYVSAAELESDYRHPRRDSYVPPRVMWSVVLAAPCLAAAAGYLASRDMEDVSQSFLAVTLALGINAVFTDTIKLIAGRPRPDFFYRCFPDGVMTADLECTGDPKVIADGRMSFPSGHSSFSFCSLGFVSLWARGRLGAGGTASGARLLVCLTPLYIALVISLSRSCDYHHHWQDILAGALLGLTIAYACYRQYYPPLGSDLAGVPYARGRSPTKAPPSEPTEPQLEAMPLLNGTRRTSKWI